MRKRLLLLRHADTRDDSINGEDSGRPLSTLGFYQAHNLGRFLKENNVIPNYIMTSLALRTKQTAEAIQEGCGQFIRSDADFEAYRIDPQGLMEKIWNFPGTAGTVLIINHNPTIFELAQALAKGPKVLGTEQAHETLSKGYPPCTLSVFEYYNDRWADFDPSAAQLHKVLLADRDLGTDE